MNTHAFTLTFSLPKAGVSEDELIERLGEAGCTDSLVGLGQPGIVELTFDREAESAREAVSTAIADVKRAVPDATLEAADIPEDADLAALNDIVYEFRVQQKIKAGLQAAREGRTLPHYEVKRRLARHGD